VEKIRIRDIHSGPATLVARTLECGSRGNVIVGKNEDLLAILQVAQIGTGTVVKNI
jgi:hypothetical protein